MGGAYVYFPPYDRMTEKLKMMLKSFQCKQKWRKLENKLQMTAVMSIAKLNYELVQSIHELAFTKGLKALLKGADPNHEIAGGPLTPLLMLFQQDYSITIKHFALVFLEYGADPCTSDEYNRSMYHYAALWGDLELLKFVRELKVNVNAKDYKGRTALHYSICHNKDFVEEMLNQGVDINAIDDMHENALHMIQKAPWKERSKIIDLLIERGINVNARCINGNTPLLNLTSPAYANTEMIKAILKHRRTDVNLGNYRGLTPLIAAVLGNEPDIVELLLDAGANVNQKYQNHENVPLLYIAATQGYRCFEAFQRMLRHTDVDLYAKWGKSNLSLFHAIVMGDDVRNIKPLMKIDYKLSKALEQGNTVLHIAAETGSIKMMKFFVKHEIPINSKNKAGNTPLHLAACSSLRPDALKMLVRLGANVDLRNNDNSSILQAAFHAKNDNNFVELLKARYKPNFEECLQLIREAPKEAKLWALDKIICGQFPVTKLAIDPKYRLREAIKKRAPQYLRRAKKEGLNNLPKLMKCPKLLKRPSIESAILNKNFHFCFSKLRKDIYI